MRTDFHDSGKFSTSKHNHRKRIVQSLFSFCLLHFRGIDKNESHIGSTEFSAGHWVRFEQWFDVKMPSAGESRGQGYVPDSRRRADGEIIPAPFLILFLTFDGSSGATFEKSKQQFSRNACRSIYSPTTLCRRCKTLPFSTHPQTTPWLQGTRGFGRFTIHQPINDLVLILIF